MIVCSHCLHFNAEGLACIYFCLKSNSCTWTTASLLDKMPSLEQKFSHVCFVWSLLQTVTKPFLSLLFTRCPRAPCITHCKYIVLNLPSFLWCFSEATPLCLTFGFSEIPCYSVFSLPMHWINSVPRGLRSSPPTSHFSPPFRSSKDFRLDSAGPRPSSCWATLNTYTIFF